MDQIVPRTTLVDLMAPYYLKGEPADHPFAFRPFCEHFMLQWFRLSDPVMEEAFFNTPLYGEFAQFQELSRLPDESTILRFRHLLEKHKLSEQILQTVNDLLTELGLLLKVGTATDATLIAASTSTKNKEEAKNEGISSSQS